MPRTDIVIYKDRSGEAPLLKWMDRLPRKVQNKWTQRFAVLREFGCELRRPICDYLRNEIYELRVKRGKVNYRVLYSFVGQNIVLLSHGCSKEKEVPASEIDRAVYYRENYLSDPRAHTYVQE
ncbi:MAG: type II toxin-antitoxin system RelE/ParE family toxin [Planctomycetota bacterium]|nr:MAG: type II toxin-antitoxin system RelE/ParE family toxin [Planctomycetota bacterium]